MIQSKDFSSDKEFFRDASYIHQALEQAGWKKEKSKIENRMIIAYYTKNGYGISLIYGCNEDVKKELLF